MTKYISLNELPSSDALIHPIRGNEPDIPLAFEMLQARIGNFERYRVLWDIVLPEGANDSNRIELNASRLRAVRFLGGYSLIHIFDTSKQDVLTGHLEDSDVEKGVRIGINMRDMTDWTRGRYKSVTPLMNGDTPMTAEDVFWADELEGAVGYGFEEASKYLSPIRGIGVAKLAQLPGLFKVRR